MRIPSHVSANYLAISENDEKQVLDIIKTNFPFLKTIKVERVDKAPFNPEYPNAKYNKTLIGLTIRGYYENPIIGRNIRGERIATSGIKFKLHDTIDAQGVRQYEMTIYGIGFHFRVGAKDLSVIDVRLSSYEYEGYQYDTNIEEMNWSKIAHFFKEFITMRQITKTEMRKIVGSFSKHGDINDIVMKEY